jgi:tetratricopeptide (TPR) repeat protein
MTESSADQELFYGEVTDAILAELRAGRQPDVTALARRYPDLAGELEAHAAQLAAILRCAPAGEPDAEGAEMPRRLGDFRLLREVGRGGMGVVYEAEQQSLRRRVALKVLPFATLLDPLRLQRFQHEAEAAARLHHPHIVPVFAVGCEHGLHYYAMQLVDGRSAAALVQDLRRQASRPGPAATATQDTPEPAAIPRDASAQAHFGSVARWGLQAAEALHYAHEVGIIHRDIKPANLLLDGRGDLWVTDFGLARLRGEAELTATGDTVGTLRYMSPEQALGIRGVADHRVDLYSLGATLYELLTLEPALPGEEREEMFRRLLDGQPKPPRALEPALPVDLETIVLKALRKEPAERYASARDLADDLKRFLDGQPIHARRPRWRERARGWARRHAVGLTITGGALLVVSIVLAVSTAMTVWAYHEASRRQAEAEQAHQEAARKQAEAERSRAAARRVVGDLFSAVVLDWLDNDAALEPLQRQLLEQLLASCQELAREDPDDAAAQSRVAQARFYVGSIQGRLGQHDAAVQSHAEVLAILADLARRQENPSAVAIDRVKCLMNQGNSFQALGSRDRAEQTFREAQALMEPLAADPTCRFQLALALDALGVVLQSDRAHADEAEKDHHRAIVYFTELTRTNPQEPRTLYPLARAHNNLAAALARANRLRDAAEPYGQAVEEFRQLHHDNPTARPYREGLALSLANQARNSARSGRLRQALEPGRQAVDIATGLANDFPNIPSYRERQAGHLLALVEALGPSGQLQEAEKAVGQAIEILTKLVADFPEVTSHRQRLAEAQLLLGICRANMGRWADAEPPFRASVLLQLPLVRDNPQQPKWRENLEKTLPRLRALEAMGGRYAEARECQREIAQGLERLAQQHPDDLVWKDALAETQGFLGALHLCLGNSCAAAAHYHQQRELLQAWVGPDATAQPDAALRLARFLTSCPVDRYRDPRAALALVEQLRRSPHGSSSAGRIVRAAACNGLGQYQDAFELLGPLTPEASEAGIDLCMQRALAQHGLGRREQAVESLRGAAAAVRPGQPVDLDRRFLLAEVSELLGDPELIRKFALPSAVDKAPPERK